MSGAKKSNKCRKLGRNASYCLSYKNTNKREKNKIKKLVKHLARLPNDAVAKAAIARCKTIIGIK